MKTIVVHGGAGAPPTLADGCEAAALAGFELLRGGGLALDAAIAAVVALEDDERFNAGTGSVLRLDGESIEMDASVMDSRGRLGAVAAVSRVRNPVLVARRVADTPHVLLAGDGAERFARRLGFEEYRHVSEKARARHRGVVEALRRKEPGSFPPGWDGFDPEVHWNFQREHLDITEPGDTVGAVTLDSRGSFAVASSTGGSVPMLAGRVGDTPLVGCGFYAGEHGAVAATGIGEEIIRLMLARAVYDAIASGDDPQAACDTAIDGFPKGLSVGVIAVTHQGHAIASNVPMASWVATEA